MLRAYFYAGIEGYIRNHHFWRRQYSGAAFRVLRWAIHGQLRGVQYIGQQVDVTGPININNQGYIKICDHAIIRSSWHRPVCLSLVTSQAQLLIEESAFINWGVNIGVAKKVVIGAYAEIADDCIIYDTDWHPVDGSSNPADTSPTQIGRGVWLGARVVVLKGVTIGDNTIVAANSTVTTDLPPGVLAGGNPARVIHPIQRTKYKP